MTSKSAWYTTNGKQQGETVETSTESEVQVQKKQKKASKEPSATTSFAAQSTESESTATVKVVFEGEAAQRILKFEAELRERLAKPNMGKILGQELLTWSEKRWSELLEENTGIEYFFEQISKCPDKSKAIKLLKGVSEKLRSELVETNTVGLSVGVLTESAQSEAV